MSDLPDFIPDATAADVIRLWRAGVSRNEINRRTGIALPRVRELIADHIELNEWGGGQA